VDVEELGLGELALVADMFAFVPEFPYIARDSGRAHRRAVLRSPSA
jgi:hypothetical protein